jgi:Flp pilus assembly protein TadD
MGMARQALATLSRIGDPDSFEPAELQIWGESFRSLERYEEAIEPLRRAAESVRDDVNLRLALGWCYKRVGRLDLAIDTLEQALAFEPDEPLLRYNLACYLSLSGNKPRALRNLSQALSLAPGYRTMIDNEPDFDPLRHDPDFQSLCRKTAEES